jgi:sulfur-carrier protein adenylyltransferase/sulfurtransferase
LKLKNARVLIIGAGGLGSPASLYLAGAGVGTIGIVDADKVDESNLHRQVIHTEEWIGQPKVLSAKHSIGKFNSRVQIVTYEDNMTP